MGLFSPYYSAREAARVTLLPVELIVESRTPGPCKATLGIEHEFSQVPGDFPRARGRRDDEKSERLG